MQPKDMKGIAIACVFLCLTSIVRAQNTAFCWWPFSQASGNSNLCFLAVPTGEPSPQLFCDSQNAKTTYPTPVEYHQPMNICYYLKGSGDDDFPQGCCNGGLPLGR